MTAFFTIAAVAIITSVIGAQLDRIPTMRAFLDGVLGGGDE